MTDSRETLAGLLIAGKPVPYHPDYKRNELCIKFWELSFRGGHAYKGGKDASGEDVFIPHEHESNEGQERRKRIATYRNYCRPIVQKYNKFIFTQTIVRDGKNKAFAEWSKDVDNLSTNLHEYMRRSSENAAVTGVRFSLMESTKSDPKETQSQAKAAGNRLFLIDIHPLRILDWIKKSGRYVEVLIGFPEENQVRRYTANEVQIATLDPEKPNMIKSVDAPIPHGYERIPLVKTAAMHGDESQICDIAEINKALFNMDALLREELQRQTFTQYLLSGIDAEKLEAAVPIGGRKFLCAKSPDVTAVRLSADTSQAESIRATIEQDIGEIWRLAGLNNPDVVQNTESGRALKIKWNDVAMTAAAIADESERAENEIIELWSQGMRTAEAVEPTDYPEEFDVEDLIVELANALDVLDSQMPGTIKRLHVLEYAKRKFPKMKEDELKELEAEIDAMLGVQEEKEELQLEQQRQAVEPDKSKDKQPDKNNFGK